MNPRYSRYYTYIKPVLINKRVRTYSGLVFSLITIAIFSVFAIRPTLATIIGLQKSIKEQEEILDKLKTKSQNIATGKANYDKLPQSTKTKIESLIPQRPQLSHIINTLNSLALKNEASVSALQFEPLKLKAAPSQPIRYPNLEEISFNFNLQGSYPKLLNILTSLTNADRLLSIKSININKSEDAVLVMSVTAKAFLLAEQQTSDTKERAK